MLALPRWGATRHFRLRLGVRSTYHINAEGEGPLPLLSLFREPKQSCQQRESRISVVVYLMKGLPDGTILLDVGLKRHQSAKVYSNARFDGVPVPLRSVSDGGASSLWSDLLSVYISLPARRSTCLGRMMNWTFEWRDRTFIVGRAQAWSVVGRRGGKKEISEMVKARY